jgi:hypothetical protein
MTIHLGVAQEDKYSAVLEGPCDVWRFVFLSQSINPSTRANCVFSASIASDYGGSTTEDDDSIRAFPKQSG